MPAFAGMTYDNNAITIADYFTFQYSLSSCSPFIVHSKKMDPVVLSAFIFFAITSTITPGPNNIMMMNSGARFGFRATIPHILGVVVGFPTLVFAAGLGLGAIMQANPIIHTIIRWLGVSYMLWMAYKMYGAASLQKKKSDVEKKEKNRPFMFHEVVLFQWINPKAWTMGMGAVAAYTVPVTAQGMDFLHQLLILVGIFCAVGIPSAIIWTGFGKAISGFLGTEKRLRIFNIIMALLLVASVIPIIVEGLS
jgi:threonine/homoserine/homoserine lactone efflux protein